LAHTCGERELQFDETLLLRAELQELGRVSNDPSCSSCRSSSSLLRAHYFQIVGQPLSARIQHARGRGFGLLGEHVENYYSVGRYVVHDSPRLIAVRDPKLVAACPTSGPWLSMSNMT
jgi:hypothetical protein